MSKKIEESSNRTMAEPVVAVHASRDEEVEELGTDDLVEEVEITEEPEEKIVELSPREEIYAKHDKKRAEEAGVSQDEEAIANDDSIDIIEDNEDQKDF